VFYAAIALLPACLLLIWLYTRDKLHPEPKRRVYKLYLLGAAIVLPAGLLERAMLNPSLSSAGIQWLLLTAFGVAGMIEEFLKAAIVDRKAFQPGYMKTPMDCIVYAGAVALGFATVENLLYVTSSGFSTAILRSVTAVPAHLMFGIIMGRFFAMALNKPSRKAFAYIVPALVHGSYDTFALSNTVLGDVLLVGFLLVLLEVTLRQLDWATRGNLRVPQHAE